MRKKKSKCQSDTSEIPRHVVITFVKLLEKAEQYFELKDRLRGRDDVQYHLCVPDESINGVIEEVKADERFKMLDEEDVLHAADMLNRELVYTYLSEIAAPRYIRNLKTNNTAEISAEEMEKRICEKYPLLRIKCDDPPGADYFIRRDPMYYLVYQKCAKGFVPNPNPEVEIKQLQEKFPFYYNRFFHGEGSKYKKRIVTFRCVGCDDVTKFLKLLLSDCGEIASVDIISLDEQSQMAHVTFGDVTAADEALCFAANGFPGKKHLIGDHMVDIIPAPYHELPWVPPGHIKLEEVEAAKSFAQNAENDLYEHAVKWYRSFVEGANARNASEEGANARNASEEAEGSKRTNKSNARNASEEGANARNASEKAEGSKLTNKYNARNASEKAEGSKRTKKSNDRRARRRAEAREALGSS